MDILKRKINAIKTNIKEIPKENLFLIFLIAVFALSLLSDLSIIPLPDFVIMNFENKPSLSLALFSAQATLATVGIAVISMITGMVNDYAYGISISQYITSIKQKFFKHERLIFVSLLSVLINYFFVSYSMVNSSIAVFFLNIVIAIYMMNNIFKVFKGKNSIEEEIKQHLLKNYRESDIIALQREMSDAIDSSNLSRLHLDQEMLTLLFEQETEKSKQGKTGCMKAILRAVSDITHELYLQNNLRIEREQIENIVKLYKISNNKEVVINIWEAYNTNILRIISDLSYSQIYANRAENVILSLIVCIYENMKLKMKLKHKEYIYDYYDHFLSRFFNAIKDNKTLEIGEKRELWKTIHDHALLPFLSQTLSPNIKEEGKIKIQDLCWLYKDMIDAGEYETIKSHFDNVIYYQSEGHLFLILTIGIYLYYITQRESLPSNTKENIKPIEGEIKKALINVLGNRSDWTELLPNFYHSLREILRHWEYNESRDAIETSLRGMDFKDSIIFDVIEDFFIFSSLLFCSSDSDENLRTIIRTISITEGCAISIYSRALPAENESKYKNLYKEFLSFLGKSEDGETIESKYSRFKSILEDAYKKEEIERGKRNGITEEDKREFEKYIQEKLKSIIDEKLKVFHLEENRKEDVSFLNNQMLLSWYAHRNEFKCSRKCGELNELDKKLEECLLISTLCRIKPFVCFEDIESTEKEKQKPIIEAIQSPDLSCDFIIGSDRLFCGEKDFPSNRTKNMKRVEFSGGLRHYFVLDSSRIEIDFSNIRVEFRDLTLEEIKGSYKIDEDGNIRYNAPNDIYLSFGEKELLQHISNIRKCVSVFVDIKYRIRGEKVGAGVHVTVK